MKPYIPLITCFLTLSGLCAVQMHAQQAYAQKVFQLDIVELPPTTDPMADLTTEQVAMLIQQETELYETIIRADANNTVQEYVYRPVYLSEPATRTVHERIERCVTTAERTYCLNLAGVETSGYATSENSFSDSMMLELSELIGNSDTVV